MGANNICFFRPDSATCFTFCIQLLKSEKGLLDLALVKQTCEACSGIKSKKHNYIKDLIFQKFCQPSALRPKQWRAQGGGAGGGMVYTTPVWVGLEWVKTTKVSWGTQDSKTTFLACCSTRSHRFGLGDTQYKRPYRDVQPTWVAKSTS